MAHCGAHDGDRRKEVRKEDERQSQKVVIGGRLFGSRWRKKKTKLDLNLEMDKEMYSKQRAGPIGFDMAIRIRATGVMVLLAIIRDEVTKYCLRVLHRENALNGVNHIHIVLIPKVSTPNTMSLFRLTSLCFVLYKIISEVIANRLKRILDCCIDEAQWAFILEGLISDNILATYKILHAFKRCRYGKKCNFSLKLNMNKAYGRV
ncbi:reverse transcriptase [Gossypium australe]|uniref:Reverse transcriptase n=1 Tax=Gossypium australe TaxID=47621 RepID=A0A5B6VYG7_9ROSI|nr:reverse transcriptase [Gossypium australe]